MIRQFSKFVVVGLLSTLLNYGVFYLLLRVNMHYLFASATGFIAGTILGYVFNAYWTFGQSQLSWKVFGPYLTVYAASLALSLVVLRILVHHVGLFPELANVMVIGLTTCTNFLGVKFLVFKK